MFWFLHHFKILLKNHFLSFRWWLYFGCGGGGGGGGSGGRWCTCGGGRGGNSIGFEKSICEKSNLHIFPATAKHCFCDSKLFLVALQPL